MIFPAADVRDMRLIIEHTSADLLVFRYFVFLSLTPVAGGITQIKITPQTPAVMDEAIVVRFLKYFSI